MLTSDTFTRLCRARDMLREVHDRPVTLDAVAREAAMSPFHFVRQFRALFGETPHQSRIQAQVDRAKHLLALEQASVIDVCMEVGFSSLGSFSDLSEPRVGVRPSNYRRRARQSRSRVDGGAVKSEDRRSADLATYLSVVGPPAAETVSRGQRVDHHGRLGVDAGTGGNQLHVADPTAKCRSLSGFRTTYSA